VALSVRQGYREMKNNLTLGRRFAAAMTALGRAPREVDARVGAGSTDMGDISQHVPSIHPYLAICDENEALCHQHRFAACAKSPRGFQTMLIAAKALAMPSVALQRILIFLNPVIGESVQRVFDLASLYERVSADAAHKIIASLRGREPVRTRKPAHRPMYYDDEATRGRRGSITRRPAAAEPQAPARSEPTVRQRTM